MSVGPQTLKVLKILRKGHKLTRANAMVYGVMNLTARISDLRNLGYDVRCEIKHDADNRRYGEFSLAA